MARQRFIHPEIWTDPSLGSLKPIERLFFIGCFSNADDEGRLLGNPAYLRSTIFPYDNFSLEEIKIIRDNVVRACRSVVLYEVNNIEYIAFLKWKEYQKPKYPKPSRIPPPPENSNQKTVEIPKSQPNELINNLNNSDENLEIEEDSDCSHKLFSNIDNITFKDQGNVSPKLEAEVQTLEKVFPKVENITSQHWRNVSPMFESNVSNIGSVGRVGLGRDGLGMGRDELGLGMGEAETSSANPTPIIDNLTDYEKRCLNELASVPGYKVDYEKDVPFLRELINDFPELDILQQLKTWKARKIDEPLTKKTKPRAQIRNWCNKTEEWRKERLEKTKQTKPVKIDRSKVEEEEDYAWFFNK